MLLKKPDCLDYRSQYNVKGDIPDLFVLLYASPVWRGCERGRNSKLRNAVLMDCETFGVRSENYCASVGPYF
ncbi:hypothetical protein Bhyg_11700 [Pseudolycoriella hygida]|uniref:Uncharacterized protein n=1 Tax=Pseudolycoriella hygida TaxID=35572 RepID=A0A9Q0MVU4_9DIPT|nr:hypothetical protein Bhyg_11700 [Pseudolycoriella hygida]